LADASKSCEAAFAALAARVARAQPYLPLIAIDPQLALADNAIPSSNPGASDSLIARCARRCGSAHCMPP